MQNSYGCKLENKILTAIKMLHIFNRIMGGIVRSLANPTTRETSREALKYFDVIYSLEKLCYVKNAVA